MVLVTLRGGLRLAGTRNNRAAWILALAVCSSGVLWSEETAVEEPSVERATEPTPSPPETAKVVTEDAPTVDPGRTEVEFNYSYAHASRDFNTAGNVRDRGTLDTQLFTLAATRGLVDGLDATASVTWQNLIEDGDGGLEDGFGNVVVNAKWRLFQNEDETVTFSWLPGFTAPFSAKSRRKEFFPIQNFWSVDNRVALTFVAERFNMSFDGGYALPLGVERDQDRGTITGNIGLGYQLTTWLQPQVELDYAHGFVAGDDDVDSMGATVGVILNLPRDTRIDLGFQQTFYGRNTEVLTGVVANFSLTF